MTHGTRTLTALAWLNLVLHVIGLGCAALWMAPGTPLVPLDERLTYLTSRPLGWVCSWFVWMACSLVFLAFVWLRCLMFQRLGVAGKSALVLGILAIFADLPCDMLYIYVLPEIARAEPQAYFLQFERNLVLASVVLANGAYTLSVGAMVIRLRQIGEADHAITVLGGITVACGLLMCVAAIANDHQLLKYATGPTILAFSLWGVFVARAAEAPRASSPSGST